MSELDRIRWNCRRGMLELDLILEGFIERHLDQLDPRQLEILGELLDYPDNDLLDLLMGRAELTDLRCAPLLAMMRAGH
jgi:antitoxin CptB